MKVLENTRDRLILEHLPIKDVAFQIAILFPFVAIAMLFIYVKIYVGAILFGAMGIGLPMLGLYLSAARSQLIFDRATDTLSFRRRGFRGMVRQDFTLTHVERIYVAKKGDPMAKLVIEVTGGMDAGHHAFPKDFIKIAPVLAAHKIATDWLTQ